MKKENTNTVAYVEPEGFKGNHGKFMQHYNSISLEGLPHVIIATVHGAGATTGFECNFSLLIQSKEMAKALQEAILFEEKKLSAAKRSADYHNNNTPNVGQTIAYESYSPLPAWVELAKQVLKSAGL